MPLPNHSRLAGLPAHIRQVGFFALPLIATTLISIVPTLISMWFLSRLGKDQLAAAALASQSFYTVLTFFATGFYAVGIKVGHCWCQRALASGPLAS